MKALEKAREHVRRKGHTLSWREGSRQWSAVTVFCRDCPARWSILRSDAPHAEGLVAHLNATPREIPTFWERLDLED